MTVSYTHLDVYKRQINNRSKLEEDFGTPEEKIDAEKGDWEACMTFNAVSYTHLDVYKRQRLHKGFL